MTAPHLSGLIAATYTPLDARGALRLDTIAPLTEHLVADGVAGLYVCGSTGEGMSLASDERRAVTEAYVRAAAGRVPVVVQVGHNSLAEARALAAHAQEAGADAVSATAPSYFGVDSVETLVACMREVAGGAPELPFFYYHIPALTKVDVDLPRFLEQGAASIPNLAGVKFTTPELHVYQACRAVDERLEVLWGVDEMLAAAWTAGARGAIGSTYNVAAPHYRRLLQALEAGDVQRAQALQLQAIGMIDELARYPFHPAMKVLLRELGFDCGACRLPQRALTADEEKDLLAALDRIGFHDWARAPFGG